MVRLLINSSVNKSVLWVFLLTCILSSCSQGNNLSGEVSIDEVKITVGLNQLSTYQKFSVWENNGESCYIGYNNFTHSFDLFDLSNSEFKKSIKLASDGPNKVRGCGKFVFTESYIFVFSLNMFLYILDHDGKVLKFINTLEFLELQGLALAPMDITFSNATIQPIILGDSLVFPIYNFLQRTNKSLYEDFYIARLSTRDSSLFDFEMSLDKQLFPDYYGDHFFGDLDLPYLTNLGESLVINFPAENALWAQGESKIIDPMLSYLVANDFQRELHKDIGLRNEYFFSSPRFFYPVYDSYRELIYIMGKEETENDGNQKYENHKLYILNHEFELVKVLPLGRETAPHYFVGREGLYIGFNGYSIASESILQFKLVKLQ